MSTRPGGPADRLPAVEVGAELVETTSVGEVDGARAPSPRRARGESVAFLVAAGLHLPGLLAALLAGDGPAAAPVALGVLTWGTLGVAARRAVRRGRAVARGLLTTALVLEAVALTASGLQPPRTGNVTAAVVGLVAVCACAVLLTRLRHVPVVLVPVVLGQAVVLRAADAAAGVGGVRLLADVVTVVLSTVATTLVIAWLERERWAGVAALERAATTDPLTGLSNRRGLAQARDDLVRPGRGSVLGVVVLDVDHFKAVNDRRGHDVGDEVLVTVARTLRDCSRPGDRVVRLGGEELAWVASWPDVAAVAASADRLRQQIAAATAAAGEPVTVSAGVAVLAPGTEPPGTQDPVALLLRRADRALYRAKAGGRDRVEVATPADD